MIVNANVNKLNRTIKQPGGVSFVIAGTGILVIRRSYIRPDRGWAPNWGIDG
jgi:hypothetical protein